MHNELGHAHGGISGDQIADGGLYAERHHTQFEANGSKDLSPRRRVRN
jgi:hypothetical protein